MPIVDDTFTRCLWVLGASILVVGSSCREGVTGPDGGSDASVDGDADTDADADSDGGGDADQEAPCAPQLTGPCNPVTPCGCPESEVCVLTTEGQNAVEACSPDPPGTAIHGEPCPCAPGHACIDVGGGGQCLRYCVDESVCPERSSCEVTFTLGEIDPDPYAACSPQLPEADAEYGTCVGAAGSCPGNDHSHELVFTESGFSCSVDLTEDEWITASFELMDGDVGIRATNLRARRSPTSSPPSTCDSFTIIEGGESFAPTECVPGLPGEGTCVVNIHYSSSDGALTGNFNCRDIPSSSSDDALSTLNDGSLGMGAFNLRVCGVEQ